MKTFFVFGWRGRVLVFVARLLGFHEAGTITTGSSSSTYFQTVPGWERHE